MSLIRQLLPLAVVVRTLLAAVPQGWVRRKGVYCTSANRYREGGEEWKNVDPDKAVEKCASLAKCIGIYDFDCDGKTLRLCMKPDGDGEALVGREGMCTYLKPGTEDEVCHDATEMDECYQPIMWAMDTGRVDNPQWYNDFGNFVPGMNAQDASFEDFQTYYVCKPWFEGKKPRCGGLPCGRSCPTADEPTPPPTDAPAPEPQPKLTINPRDGYGRRQGRVCWKAGRVMSDEKDNEGNPVPLSFTSAHAAVKACDENDDCIGITDFKCDGAGLLFLCRKGEDTMSQHGESCTYMKPGVLEQTCHKVNNMDDCWNSIQWAMNTGSKDNPQWYNDFKTFVPDVELADATVEDWQQYFYCHPRFPDDDPEKRHNCGLGACGRQCPAVPTVAPTKEPEGYTSDWSRRKGLVCWKANQVTDGNGEALGFDNIEDAVAACDSRPNCQAVSDYKCDGGMLRLCKKNAALVSAPDSCVFAKPGTESAICHDATIFDACWGSIKWAMDTGRKENPQWYNEYKSFVDNPPATLMDMTFEDFQMYFHCNEWFNDKKANCGAPVCGRTCPETATKPPTEAPTEAPKDLVIPTVADGYGRDMGVICWKDSRIMDGDGNVILFADVTEAMKACDKNEECMGLADFNCDGQGNWAMCAVGKPMASDGKHCTYMREGRVDELCHELTAQDDCYNDVLWTMETGREENPQWYANFNQFVPGVDMMAATALDWQMYFHCNTWYDEKRHNCGIPVCGRKCPVTEKTTKFPKVEGWARRTGLACWNNNRILTDKKNDKGDFIPLAFTDPAVALSECEKRDDCQAVFDANCDGQGNFFMCKEVSKMVDANEKHCSYIDSRFTDDVCHDLTKDDACFADITWALDNYKEREDLFQPFERIVGKSRKDDEITAEDFQLYFHCNPWFRNNNKRHACAAGPCGRECPETDDTSETPTPAPTPKPEPQRVDYKGWNRRKNLYCFSDSRMKTDEVDKNGKPKDLYFENINDAIIRCAQEPTCIGISDWECDDTGRFFICTGEDKPVSRRGDCMYMKPSEDEDATICHDADERDDCYSGIKWALDQGRFEHPEWYNDFEEYVPGRALKDANIKDMQMYFHCHPGFGDRDNNCGAPVCDRKCGRPGYITMPKGYTRKMMFCTKENRLQDGQGETLSFPGVFAAAAACNEREDCIAIGDYNCNGKMGGGVGLCKKDAPLQKTRNSCIYAKPGVDVEKCHDITPMDECYLDVEWAYTTGKKNNPENYADFAEYTGVELEEASFQEFQLYFFCHGAFRDQAHNCGYPPCGMKCKKRDMSGTKAPTPAPVKPQVPSDKTWGRKQDLACWLNNQVKGTELDDEGNPKSLAFQKIDDAIAKCKELGDGCAGVFDWKCDGTGDFRLCEAAAKIAGKEGMCIYVKPTEEKKLCHTANQLDECYGHIAWAVDNEKGIKANADHGWFNDFKTYVGGAVTVETASYEDMQLYFHCKHKLSDDKENVRNCGLPPCGRECKPQPQIPTVEGWYRRRGHMCWSGNWVNSDQKDDKGKKIAYSFDKIDDALAKCDELGDGVCGGVTDWNCDATPAFKLCGAGDHVQKGVDQHCVWVKGAYKEKKCHDITPLDTCYSHVVWAMNEGRKTNPQWYSDFATFVGEGVNLMEANAEHFQLYFHCKLKDLEEERESDCGAPPCGDYKCANKAPVALPTMKPVEQPKEAQIPDVSKYGRRAGTWCPKASHVTRVNDKGDTVSWFMGRDKAVEECDKRDDCVGLADWKCDGDMYVMCTTTDFNNIENGCVYVKHTKSDEICHDANELDECYSHINWALTTGRKNQPQWYDDFEALTEKKLESRDVTVEDFQTYMFCKEGKEEARANCKLLPCGRKCPMKKPTQDDDDDLVCKIIAKKNQCEKNPRCTYKNDVCMVDKEAKAPTGKDLVRLCKALKKESDCNSSPWNACAFYPEKKKCIPRSETPAPTALPCTMESMMDMKIGNGKETKLKGKYATDCDCRAACRVMSDENPDDWFRAYQYADKKQQCACVAAKKAPKTKKGETAVTFSTKKKKKMRVGPLFPGDGTIFE